MKAATRYCVICGEKTEQPFAAAVYHYRVYERGNWKFLKGNQTMFGFWDGLHSTICLAFPFYNTLIHWKYRRHFLVIPGFTDSDGRRLPPKAQP